MKKFIFLISFATAIFFEHCSQAFLPSFFYDQNGQLNFSGSKEQNDCFKKGFFYWDGNKCVEITPVKNCFAQGGEWHSVQMVKRQYFKNICLCTHNMFWDGMNCVNNLPPEKQCNIEVWCNDKMQDIIVKTTPQIMDLNTCP